MSVQTKQYPRPGADGWTECSLRYKCQCGRRGELILCRSDEYEMAVQQIKNGTFPCSDCETAHGGTK